MNFHAIFNRINKIFDDQQPCQLPGLILSHSLILVFAHSSMCMYFKEKNCSFIDHNMSLKRGMKHGSINNKCGWMNFTL